MDKKQLRTLVPEASEPLDQPAPEDEVPSDELDDKADNDSGTHDYVVSTGDTLGSSLTQFGIDVRGVRAR